MKILLLSLLTNWSNLQKTVHHGTREIFITFFSKTRTCAAVAVACCAQLLMKAVSKWILHCWLLLKVRLAGEDALPGGACSTCRTCWFCWSRLSVSSVRFVAMQTHVLVNSGDLDAVLMLMLAFAIALFRTLVLFALSTLAMAFACRGRGRLPIAANPDTLKFPHFR